MVILAACLRRCAGGDLLLPLLFFLRPKFFVFLFGRIRFLRRLEFKLLVQIANSQPTPVEGGVPVESGVININDFSGSLRYFSFPNLGF